MFTEGDLNSTVSGITGDSGGLGLGVHAVDSPLGDTPPCVGDTTPDTFGIEASTPMGSVHVSQMEINSIMNGSSPPPIAPCSSLLHFHA
jgi:hypothetical protein